MTRGGRRKGNKKKWRGWSYNKVRESEEVERRD